MKRAGLAPGYPDLALDWPWKGFHGLRIEMKRRKGSRTSPEQIGWKQRLNAAGYRSVVCYGSDEAIEALETYLYG